MSRRRDQRNEGRPVGFEDVDVGTGSTRRDPLTGPSSDNVSLDTDLPPPDLLVRVKTPCEGSVFLPSSRFVIGGWW